MEKQKIRRAVGCWLFVLFFRISQRHTHKGNFSENMSRRSAFIKSSSSVISHCRHSAYCVFPTERYQVQDHICRWPLSFLQLHVLSRKYCLLIHSICVRITLNLKKLHGVFLISVPATSINILVTLKASARTLHSPLLLPSCHTAAMNLFYRFACPGFSAI